MSLDNNYPSSNLSPDPTTEGNDLLDLGSSFTARVSYLSVGSKQKAKKINDQEVLELASRFEGSGVKLQAPSSKQQALDKITIL
jgi:hypothetical protein